MRGIAVIKPNAVVTSACEIPLAINLGSPVPNKVIDWNVSIMPVTVPSKPNRGEITAKIFIVDKYFSNDGSSLVMASSNNFSRATILDKLHPLHALIILPSGEVESIVLESFCLIIFL